jgi:hypothetical protein
VTGKFEPILIVGANKEETWRRFQGDAPTHDIVLTLSVVPPIKWAERLKQVSGMSQQRRQRQVEISGAELILRCAPEPDALQKRVDELKAAIDVVNEWYRPFHEEEDAERDRKGTADATARISLEAALQNLKF